MSTEFIDLQVRERVAIVTLNRPDKRNAFSDAMRAAWIAVMETLAASPQVRAVVVTGAGPAFCAGGDIAGMQERMNAPAGEVAFNGWSRQQVVHKAQHLLYTLPKPVIAAVNGPASGLGADIAMACDFVLAADNATFAWSYIKRGIIADGGALYFLPRRVGLAKAKELIFTGRTVDAKQALALGIADRTTAPERLLEDAVAWAQELSQGSPVALALTKGILNQSFELNAEQVFAQGSQAQGICYTSTEHRDLIAAFLDKGRARQPNQ